MSYTSSIDNMRWSFSRVTSYEQCPYEWYLHYIVNDQEEYPEEQNYYAQVGGFVHEILASVYKKEIRASDAFNYFIDNYDNYVTETVSKNIMDKTFEACADYLSKIDLITSLTDGKDILGVEQRIEFIIEGHKFIGFIDLLLKDTETGELIIVDHKSSEYPFKKNGEVKASAKSFDKYKKQLYLYAHWVHETYGEWPTTLEWNHFKDGGKVSSIPFSMDEYIDSIEWFKDKIDTIKQDDVFEANREFFYCNNLCAYRNICEYKEEED